jgi:hyperosmotically inducible protein
MNAVKTLTMVALLVAFTCAGVSVQAQGRINDERLLQLIKRLETNSDRFSNSIDAALDRTWMDGSMREDNVNALVDAFEYETDQLRERVQDREALAGDLEAVLIRGLRLDTFMRRHKLTDNAQRDWTAVKSDLDELSRAFSVVWVWDFNRNTQVKNIPVRQVIRRIESRTDEFQNTLDGALDQSSLDGTKLENEINALVQNLEKEADQLRDRIGNGSGERIASADAEAVLKRAMLVDAFMFNHGASLNDRARRDWARVRANMDELAAAYNLAWVWTIKAGPTAAVVLDRDRLQRDPQNPQMERVAMSGTVMTVGAGMLAREVRHELLSDLPYYGVFDWIEFEVLPGNAVVLRGQVTSPPDTKSRAEAVVKDIEGVNRVINEIEVLPVSPNDDRLRRALYRAIYDFDSPLFKYGVGSRQAIHIIVKDGRATLKGVVDSDMDKQLAYMKARGVSGLFEVTNQLRVDSGRKIMPS